MEWEGKERRVKWIRRTAGKGDLKRKGEAMCNEYTESKCRMKRG
jgi:hypothetical protein